MTKLESGRSMVEMLGVLAIIGVLSIGGIAGYTMAMNRNTANNIADTAAKLSVIAYSQGQMKGTTDSTVLNYNDAGMGTGNANINKMNAYLANGVVRVDVEDEGVKNILRTQAESVSGNTVTFNFSNN